jgi:hypothetical protein
MREIEAQVVAGKPSSFDEDGEITLRVGMINVQDMSTLMGKRVRVVVWPENAAPIPLGVNVGPTLDEFGQPVPANTYANLAEAQAEYWRHNMHLFGFGPIPTARKEIAAAAAQEEKPRQGAKSYTEWLAEIDAWANKHSSDVPEVAAVDNTSIEHGGYKHYDQVEPKQETWRDRPSQLR